MLFKHFFSAFYFKFYSHINSSFKEISNSSQLVIAFRKNTSLKQHIGANTIRNNQKILLPTQTTTPGQCTRCYTSRSFYCHQVLKTTTFTSTQTREIFTIFHMLLAIVTMSSTYNNASCEKFNMLESLIRLSNHRKDINAIEVCKHFNNNAHTFSKHGKFIII